MGFRVKPSSSPQTRRPQHSKALPQIWHELLPPAHFPLVAELGSGTCTAAPLFFSQRPMPLQFRAFENESKWVFPAPPQFPPGIFGFHAFDPAAGLPLPDASQDLLFTNRYLEHLRMEEFYMVGHEARRTVKMGGLWAIASLTPPPGPFAGVKAFLQRRKEPGRALELLHYVSPEDWRELRNEKRTVDGAYLQFLLLERV